jgi:16S rRNA (cytosine967-C5)-methyltransferase
VLYRAEAADAFVGVLLFRTLQRSRLSELDRALASALVFGVLRHRARLDAAVARSLDRPMETLPAAIRTILRMGAYQILDMDRIPHAAAVSESVMLARRHGHAGTAHLVNAVLRRVAAEGGPAPPDAAAAPAAHLAVVYSHPRWLIDRWLARWGFDETAALAATNLRPAPSVLRVNTLKITRDLLLNQLRNLGVAAAPGLVAEAVRVEGSIADRLALIEQGLCVVQDEGAMLVASALAPEAGQMVIDACAAPGGKTTHLAAMMGNAGRLIACDVHPLKLQALAARAAAMGAGVVEAHYTDAREAGRAWPGQADAVLVDAPCSGLGTVRRRPEIKWRAVPESLVRHAAAQEEILAGAAGAVRPGGVLVYSVCSLEPEEGPQVVQAFLTTHQAFERDPMPRGFPRTVGGAPVADPAAGEVVLLPHRHDTDGFYIARMRRR